MPVGLRESSRVVIKLEREDMVICPKCGNTRIEPSDCCAKLKWECMKCHFIAPRRIFIEGKLPSQKEK